MISLEPITIEGIDCLVNSYLTILQHDLGEYQYAFWDTWTFCYNKSVESSIGQAINIPMRIYIDNLKQYYSLESNQIAVKPWEMFKENVVKLLEREVPVMACVDTFYCNWYEDFRKKHSEHIVLIVSYANNVWNVVDTMPPRTGIKFPEEELKQGIIWASKVTFSKRSEEKSLSQFIDHTLKRKKKQQEQECLEQFVKDFDKVNLEDEIVFDKYVWSVPILRNIRRIYYSRKQFLECVNYLKTEKSYAFATDITEMFKPIIAEWAVVMNILYKMQVSKVISGSSSIKERLKKVVYMEDIAKEVIENYDFKKGNNLISKRKGGFLNVHIEFNNYSHFFEEKDFCRRTNLKSGVLWETEKVKFLFPEVNSSGYNCLTCCGQKVSLPNCKICKLHFLGYGTWGNQFSELQLIYADKIQKKEFRVSDWCLEPIFSETILWKGEFVHKKSGTIYTGHIFDVEIPVFVRKKLLYLRLPNCPEIYLFGLVAETLEEEN